jgi:hypothetical protein
VTNQDLRLFISHASDDVELARRVVQLISTALNLPAAAIRCTSVDGYRLPGGANTNEQLRREVHDAEAFIGIVSRSSLRSMYVLFELGARWGADKRLIPLIAHGVPMSTLGEPLSGLSALRADSSSQLHQLVQELGVQLSIVPQSPAVFDHALHHVVSLPAGEQPSSVEAPRATATPSGAMTEVRQDPVATRTIDVPSLASVPKHLKSGNGDSDRIVVRKGHAEVHPETGVVIGVLRVSAQPTAQLLLTFPGRPSEEIPSAGPGTIWNFEANGHSYRMILRGLDFATDTVTLQINRDPSS